MPRRKKREIIFGPNDGTLTLPLSSAIADRPETQIGMLLSDPRKFTTDGFLSPELSQRERTKQKTKTVLTTPNVDAMMSSLRGTVGPLGIHPPEEINITELRRMEREAEKLKRRRGE
ncbi:MAG: hypothetical protein HY764_04450 [Candidatus Portnoybacteria bacterium]|nr:hypothetical protein [Candidatus Portnoybacteria bacterium]